MLSERVGDRVWPGFTLGAQELVAYDGDRRQLLLGASGRPAGFSVVPQAGFGVLAHDGPLPEITRAPSPAVWLAGWPAVALPYAFVESDLTPRPAKVFAPAFSAWEQRHFADSAEYDRLQFRRYPVGDRFDLAAAELEDRLLADALRARDPADWRRLGQQFLAVRAQRRTRLAPWVSRFEDLAEKFSGLPFYVADSYADYASVDPRFLASAADPAQWQRWPQSERGVAGALDLPLDLGSLGAERYQLTGLAEARLLDRLAGPTWRAASAAGATLTGLLARAVAMPAKGLPALLQAGRQTGGWGDLVRAVVRSSRRLPPAYRAWLQLPGRKVTCWLSPDAERLRLRYARRPLRLDAHSLFAFDLGAFHY